MTAARAGVKSYSMVTTPVAGATQTGLDQLVDIIGTDPGLAGANLAADIVGGATAADRLNRIIVEAADATGAATDGVFSEADVVAMNAWIRANRLDEWTALHGDDEGDEETGFHLVQNDGATTQYRGANAVDTVADGLYHMGFEIQGGNFLNEDGNANASVAQVAAWLTEFYTDRSTTGTGLDRITDLVIADKGLAKNIPWADVAGGADAANGINGLIVDAIAALGLGTGGMVTEQDVRDINAWIKANHYDEFVALHGDDENGSETGFHLVQNDGAKTTYFGQNLVNTVADGIYHIGFDIVDGRFNNEDGNANATVADVADWITYFYADQSTTGTGLDRIVDTIKLDTGLARNTNAGDINEGAAAADGLNQMIVDAIAATGIYADNWITADDVREINEWIRENRYDEFVELHGDDENGSETGYHLVQNDGATVQYFGLNLVNQVADSIYHIGFEIDGYNLLNEDGDRNASISDVASWLNYFFGEKIVVYGTESSDNIVGTGAAEHILGYGGNDSIEGGDGDDLIEGGWGCDTIGGGVGSDLIYGQWGDDLLDGDAGSDRYFVSGNEAGGWSSFQGYDTYADSGADGVDTIVATGDGNVDIGMKSFGPASGIEVIDGSGAAGTVRLLGDWKGNTLDFTGVTFEGGNVVVDGGHGNDTIVGTAGDDTIIGGGGDDTLDGAEGSDRFQVSGNEAGGWSSFQGYDTYTDSGAAGTDTIVALGDGNVDIGLKSFGPESGIEVIDGSDAAGTVRLLGDWKGNTLDFTGVTFEGGNVVVDGGHGNDTIVGTAGDDTIFGGGGDDTLDGAEGSDRFQVSGNEAGGWSSFQGYDTYADTGTAGTDTIVAVGTGDVDVGFAGFGPASGIEAIDGTLTTGTVRLLGDWKSNKLDFSGVTLIGASFLIDAGFGNDTVIGTAGDDTIAASGGDDTLDGGEGGDTYIVTGNEAGGWASFKGYDTFADRGTAGTDTIAAKGLGDVDIGVSGFGPGSGIEAIDGTGASGKVRLLGNWQANTLDFSGVTITGGNVVIDGGHGNDIITGSAGDDTILGGGGDDTLDGADGGDTYLVSGNEAGGWSSFHGFDTYADTGGTGTDTIKAVGAGNVDIGLRGFGPASGIEAIDGTGALGTVRLLGNWEANTLDFSGVTFTGANIVIDGGHGNDAITGTDGGDTIVGGGGDDTVNGGEGGDVYRVSGTYNGGWSSFQGYDTYTDTGSTGIDTIAATGGWNVDIGLKGFGPGNGIEAIDGTGALGKVRLLGDWQANLLDFSSVSFVGANVVIDGGSGNDTIVGTSGNDTMTGGDGNDLLDGGLGDDAISGGSGTDTVTYAAFSTAVTIDLALSGPQNTGPAGFDTLSSIENAVTGAGDDTLLGNGSSNELRGGAGHDVLDGRGGNDLLFGGDGDDLFVFDKSGDRAVELAGEGTDTVRSAVTVSQSMIGNFVENIELIGSQSIGATGNGLANTITGNDAGNSLNGGDGDDTLIGRGGNDTLRGGIGNDRLVGGLGVDKLYGSLGNDTFVFESIVEIGKGAGARDRIYDFASGKDLLDLIAVDADTGTDGDQAFVYVGGSAFTGTAGELRLAGELLMGDVNGDGIADFELQLSGVKSLNAIDILA